MGGWAVGGEERRGPVSGLPLPGSIYSLLPKQSCVKFDTCLKALKFSPYLPKEERYMGHRGVILKFRLPQYPKTLVEWIHERGMKRCIPFVFTISVGCWQNHHYLTEKDIRPQNSKSLNSA